MRVWMLLVLLDLGLASVCLAQPAATPTPAAQVSAAPPPTAAPPSDIDVRMIRYKISAGDLPSAESILEYHGGEGRGRERYRWGWRGSRRAALTGMEAASRWRRRRADRGVEAEDVRLESTAKRSTSSARRSKSGRRRLTGVRRPRRSGPRRAHGRSTPRRLHTTSGRTWKRRNMIELQGARAGGQAEGHVGAEPPPLEPCAESRSSSTWWEACGDLQDGEVLQERRREVRRQGRRFRRADPHYTADRAEGEEDRSPEGDHALPAPSPRRSPTRRCFATGSPPLRPSCSSTGRETSSATASDADRKPASPR